MTRADIEQRAAYWLMRREDAEWSADDQLAFDRWITESTAHMAAFWRLEHAWDQMDRLRALAGSKSAMPKQNAKAFGPVDWDQTGIAEQPNQRLRLGVRWIAAIAASVLLVLSAGLFLSSLLPQTVRPIRYATATGQQGVLALTDGSKIELNTDTALRVRQDGVQRAAWLDHGEAYFDVVHDPEHPFVVSVGSRQVTVLGTKFALRREGTTLTVSVLEGGVRLDSEPGAEHTASMVIGRGDVAIAGATSTLIASNVLDRIEASLAWRNGMVQFDRATLAEAAAEFNRYNQKRIIVTDAAAANLRVGGSFKAGNVDAFARLVHLAYGLRVDNTKAEIKISSR